MLRRPAGSKRRSGDQVRVLAVIGWLAIVMLAAPPAAAQRTPEGPKLTAVAERFGLRDIAGFVEAVQSLRETQGLPPRYVTKHLAKSRGWRGGGLCEIWPGRAIGGDVFHNFTGNLPAAPGRVYREADLDAPCNSRGAKRLIFSSDGLIFVTVDHYNSFTPVP